MIISSIVHNGETKGNLIQTDPKEAQLLLEAMQFYCDNNKRKQNAKKLLKYMNQNLECF